MDWFKQFEENSEDGCTVFNIKDISSRLYLKEDLQKETDVINMASLSALMLLNEAGHKADIDDAEDATTAHHLSLAYERLHTMPKILLEELSPHIMILDISHNEFENLSFLSEFRQLTTLICDHNNINSFAEIPYLPNLELLWMNYCKIKDLYPWANNLHQSCPSLKYLSLMGNPAAPSYLNGGNFYEYLQYRYFMISLFPNLIHLDDRRVTDDQREEAQRLYKRPLVEKMITRSQNLPYCIRSLKNKVSNLFSPVPTFAISRQRNNII